MEGMLMRRAILVLVLATSAAVFTGAQTDTLDYAMLGRIRDEGLTRSQVMDHISWLSDVYGPRLTGSPGIQQAGEWAMKTLNGWGPNMDTFDRVQREDMVQQATVIAVFAYNAAMRPDKLPRKALPAAQRARGSSQNNQD